MKIPIELKIEICWMPSKKAGKVLFDVEEMQNEFDAKIIHLINKYGYVEVMKK
jgi:hypothetical protein